MAHDKPLLGVSVNIKSPEDASLTHLVYLPYPLFSLSEKTTGNDFNRTFDSVEDLILYLKARSDVWLNNVSKLFFKKKLSEKNIRKHLGNSLNTEDKNYLFTLQSQGNEIVLCRKYTGKIHYDLTVYKSISYSFFGLEETIGISLTFYGKSSYYIGAEGSCSFLVGVLENSVGRRVWGEDESTLRIPCYTNYTPFLAKWPI